MNTTTARLLWLFAVFLLLQGATAVQGRRDSACSSTDRVGVGFGAIAAQRTGHADGRHDIVSRDVEYRRGDAGDATGRLLELVGDAGLSGRVELGCEQAGRDDRPRRQPSQRATQHVVTQRRIGVREQCFADARAVQGHSSSGARRCARLTVSADLRDVDHFVAVEDTEMHRLPCPLVEVLEEGHRDLQQSAFDRRAHPQLEQPAGEAVAVLRAVEEACGHQLAC